MGHGIPNHQTTIQTYSSIFLSSSNNFVKYTCVWIYENGAKRIEFARKAGVFLSPETIFKGDDIKIKGRVIPFSLPAPVFPFFFIVVLSLFFARLHGFEAA